MIEPRIELLKSIVQMQQAYEYLDSTVKIPADKKGVPYNISCTKGCAHCCRLLVTASTAEGLVLANRIIYTCQVDFWLPKLVLAAKRYDRHNITETAYFNRQFPCVFLNNNLCSFYNERPAVCRYHFVITPSINCAYGAVDPVVGRLDTYAHKNEVLLQNMGSKWQIGNLPTMVLLGLRSLTTGHTQQNIITVLSDLPTAEQWVKRFQVD